MSETTWANLPHTCADFVEHPHRVEGKIYDMNGNYKETRLGNCYTCQVASASESQGTTAIASALMDAGIEGVEVEQTGGFCMVVYIYGKTKERNILANAEGVGLELNKEGEFNDYIELTSPTFTPIYDEGCPPENCAEIVEMVKKNLHLLK